MADINYIGTIPLGKIQRWENKKSASITPIPFPGQDSGMVEGIDTLGIIAYINFSGVMTGDFSLVQGYLGALAGIADGKQTSARFIRSPFVNARDTGNNIRRGFLSVSTAKTGTTLQDTTALFVSRGVSAASGIKPGDLVKNLVTGNVAEVQSVDSETKLTLKSFGGGTANIFSDAGGESYAVTTSIAIKLLDVNWRWELPGLSYCYYDMAVLQVRDN